MNNTPLEDQVHDGLHRTVDLLQRTPFTVTDVRTRARRIQRRRAVAAGAAVAAALAIAVPVGLAVTGPAQRSEIPPATTPPAPAITGTVRIDPRSAPVGEDLTVPLIDVDAPSVTIDGETIALPQAYDQVTPYVDGQWLAVVNDEGIRSLEVLDADWNRVDSAADVSPLTVSADGSRVAYASYDGGHWSVIDMSTTGERAERWTALPAGPRDAQVTTVGFASETEVVATQSNPSDGSLTTLLLDGTDAVEVPGLLEATAASPVSGAVAGLSSIDGDQSCSSLVDVRTGAPAWETCDHTLGELSPDGQHVVAFAEQFDAEGSPTISILDATTGEPVVDFEVAQVRNSPVGIDPAVVWEDAETLIAALVSGGQQYVVRLGLDGTVERVGGAADVEPGGVAVRLMPGARG